MKEQEVIYSYYVITIHISHEKLKGHQVNLSQQLFQESYSEKNVSRRYYFKDIKFVTNSILKWQNRLGQVAISILRHIVSTNKLGLSSSFSSDIS